MKCQQCDKSATFHITELTGGKPQELHLCEEHARQYLTQSEDDPGVMPGLAGSLAQQLAVGQTAEELARLDQRACPVCGITFYEFRNHGRLGCPYDYICFQQELEPLIVNIHGETEHVGKRPAADRRRHREPHAVDPFAAGNERSHQRGSLRTGIPVARPDPRHRTIVEPGRKPAHGMTGRGSPPPAGSLAVAF